MYKFILPALALALVSTAASANNWAPENVQQIAAAQTPGAKATTTGPATCHMVWSAADKANCLNEFPVTMGGRAPVTAAASPSSIR